MTAEEFNIEMNRLKNLYSEKAYPTERERLIFKEMRRLDISEFTAIVSELIASSQYPPMIGKFREAQSDLMRRSTSDYDSKRKAWIEAQPNCSYCAKTGYIMATKRHAGLSYAFSCVCTVGSRIGYKFPAWKPDLSRDYEPHFHSASYAAPARIVNTKAMANFVTHSIPREESENER